MQRLHHNTDLVTRTFQLSLHKKTIFQKMAKYYLSFFIHFLSLSSRQTRSVYDTSSVAESAFFVSADPDTNPNPDPDPDPDPDPWF